MESADDNVDKTTPPNLLGYYVYRSTSENEPAKLLTKTPVTGTTLRDEFFEFGKQYFYFVRAVSASTEATPIESDESNIVKVKPIDMFPPSRTGGDHARRRAECDFDLFRGNPEKDIAGYKIYRSTDPNLPKDQWTLLTPSLDDKHFSGHECRVGKTYYYYLTATDTAGNVERRSVRSRFRAVRRSLLSERT